MLKSHNYASHGKDCGVMNIAICDDNLHFAQTLESRIKDYFARIDRNCKIRVFSDPTVLLKADLAQTQILFLDIDMPGINGIDVAKEIRKRAIDLFVVYVTAWIEYAPDGYRVNAFRYLLKNRLDHELAACISDIREKMSESRERVQFVGNWN